MNGRVYDPELGRFMSADPFVQAPYNSQSYNRYSYVFNNPLSFTDPSGYQASTDCNNQNAGIGHAPGGGCVEEVKVTGDREAYEERRRQAALDQWNYESLSTWYAVNTQNQQWEYMNGTAYNLANFWGKVAFDLAAGEGAKTANTNNQASFDMSTVAFWTGATGFGFEQTRGYVGIHRANYLTDWGVYPNGWTGNKYMSTTALAGLGKNLGTFGFALGTVADLVKVRRAAPSDVKSTVLSAALNFGAGVAAYANPKRFGLFGVATGINDLYGKDIAVKSFQGAMAASPNIPHPKPENNDLDKAFKQAFVGGHR